MRGPSAFKPRLVPPPLPFVTAVTFAPASVQTTAASAWSRRTTPCCDPVRKHSLLGENATASTISRSVSVVTLALATGHTAADSSNERVRKYPLGFTVRHRGASLAVCAFFAVFSRHSRASPW